MDKKFEDKIRQLFQEDLNLSTKASMKARLMSNLHYKDSFWRSVKHAFSNVQLSVRSRVLMKEKLFAIVEGDQKRGFDIFGLRRAVAFATAFAVVFAVVLQPFTVIPTVNASSQTRIANYSGEVSLIRSQQNLDVKKEMNLQEGDLLNTGPAGFAEIIFADNSIVRVGASSKLGLKKIDRFDEREVYQVKVIEGEVWGHLVGADSDSVFKFSADNLSGTVKTDATFDIEVSDSYTRLLVVDESVDLLLSHDGEVVPTTLSEGKMIKVKKETPYLSYLDTLAFNEELSDINLDWIKGNINQDKIYEQKLIAEISDRKKKAAGITPSSPFYAFKQFKRATAVAFAVDPVKRNQLELGYANQKLLEAEVLISQGKKDQAGQLIKDYEEKVVKVKKDIDEIKKSDPDKAIQIEETLNESVKEQKKSLKNVLPDNETYEIKKAVNNIELAVASTPAQKKKVEIAQATDTLTEAKQLAEEGQDDLAKEQLSLFVGKIDEATKDIEQLTDDEVEDVVVSLIESHTETKAVLESTGKITQNNADLKEGIDIVTEVTEETFDEVVEKLDPVNANPEIVKNVEQLKAKSTVVEDLANDTVKVDNVQIELGK